MRAAGATRCSRRVAGGNRGRWRSDPELGRSVPAPPLYRSAQPAFGGSVRATVSGRWVGAPGRARPEPLGKGWGWGGQRAAEAGGGGGVLLLAAPQHRGAGLAGRRSLASPRRRVCAPVARVRADAAGAHSCGAPRPGSRQLHCANFPAAARSAAWLGLGARRSRDVPVRAAPCTSTPPHL